MRALDGNDAGGVDDGNSTSTALGAGGVFTGEWYDVSRYDSSIVAVSTDADGSYQVQYSPDGTNVDSALTSYYRTAEINPPHRYTNARRYMRVVYTNGSDAQTYLRMQVLHGLRNPLNAPLDGTLADSFDAIATRPSEQDDEVTLGRRQGWEANLKFGFNDDVDSASPEILAPFGGTWSPLAAASTLDVASTSASDTAAGTGARSLLVTGIDENRNPVTEVVVMNGTSTVTTSASFFGVNRVVVLSCGSGQKNAGDIDLSAGGAIQARVPADKSVTQQIIYHTPTGYNGLVRRFQVNVLKLSGGGSSPRITARLNVYNPGVTGAIYEVRRIRIDSGSAVEGLKEFRPPLLLSPTDVVWVEVETDTNNTIVDGEVDIVVARQVAT